MKESDKIELRSEEMKDVLTRPPHILIRSGISIICIVVFLLIIGSFFFKYPDVISGRIIITTENPPVWIIAKASGQLKELNCENKSQVRQGQILAVIENSAITNDISQVKNLLLEYIITDSISSLPPDFVNRNYELGNIQGAYSSFLRVVTDYENFLNYNTIHREKEALNLQISGHKRYSQTIQQQLKLKEEELRIAQTVYEREKQLFQKGIISQAEKDAAENTFLSIRQSLQQLRANVASDQIESAQLTESVSKLDTQYSREKNSLFSELKTAYSELLSAIEIWEQTYLLISPFEGIVTFNTFWTSNQFVNLGDKVLAVVPHHPGKIIGRIESPSSGSGKIQLGQRINIKVHGYPYLEYGTLTGKVQNISLVPNGNNYSIDVELPDGLKTGIGKTLDFTGELTGDADIITDDRSLSSRILSPLRYLINNHIRK